MTIEHFIILWLYVCGALIMFSMARNKYDATISVSVALFWFGVVPVILLADLGEMLEDFLAKRKRRQ